MSSNHILDLHDNPLYNCFVKRALEKIQPDFAVIGFLPHLVPSPFDNPEQLFGCRVGLVLCAIPLGNGYGAVAES